MIFKIVAPHYFAKQDYYSLKGVGIYDTMRPQNAIRIILYHGVMGGHCLKYRSPQH